MSMSDDHYYNQSSSAKRLKCRAALERLTGVLEAPLQAYTPHLCRLLRSFIFGGDEPVVLKDSLSVLPPAVRDDLLILFSTLESDWPEDLVEFEHFHILID
jgi:hypothetical protein